MIKPQKILNSLLLFYLFLLPWSAVYIFDEKFLGNSKWQFGTGVLYATELLLWLIMAVFIAIQFYTQRNNRQPISFTALRNKLQNPDYKLFVTIALWLFVAWAGLSIFWSAEKSAGWYLWRYYLEAGGLFFILLLSGLKTEKISWALFSSGTIQSLLSISQFLNQRVNAQKFLGLTERSPEQLGVLVVDSGGRWLRSSGGFNDPNFLGGFLAVTLILGFYLCAKTKYKKTILALLALNCFGLFFTFSRGSLLALTVALIFFLAGQRKNWQKLLPPLSVLILATGALVIIFSTLIFSRADLANRLEQKSLTERASQIRTAFDIFRQRPLIGVGLNNYTYTLYSANPGQPAYLYQEAENIYLLLLVELGIIGLALFLFLLTAIISLGIKNKNYWELCLIILLLGLGCFYHYPVSQYQGLAIFFIILTLTARNDKFQYQQAP